MCSRNDAEDGPLECMEARTRHAWTSVCQKCSKDKPVIQILQIKHAYCKDCFLVHVNHKFRSTLGKSKLMKPTDVVMAACSGSVKSNVMLHLLHAGLSEKSHKRFLFKVQVLYIDEGAVLGLSTSQRSANLKSVACLAKQYGFTAFYTSLAHAYDLDGPKCFPLHEESCLEINEDLEINLKNLFDNINSLTAKEDLLNQIRKFLLLQSAKKLCCGKIFTANTSSDIAIQILTDVSLGRGSQMHHDVTFCDGQDENVRILRPLLELSSKEVAYYYTYNSLDSVFIPSLCTKTAFDSSIHNLSKQFVMNLMENFPSTVSTVFRTGEKLGSSSTEPNLRNGEEDFCVLCKGSLDSKIVPCSSVQATEFSRLISSLGPSGFDNKTLAILPLSHDLKCEQTEIPESCCPTSSALCENHGPNSPYLSEVLANCCYGCRLILYDVKSSSCIPEYILTLVRQRRSFQDMRESIKNFLL